MKKINFTKQVLPHIIAVLSFAILVSLFYKPIIFDNKEIRQNDVLQGIGAGQEAIEYREATGEEALWTTTMFSGMPAYLINVQWTGDLLKYADKIASMGFKSPVSVTFNLLLGFYILLVVFGVNPYLAIAGAIAYGFSTFNIISIEAGHIWKVRAIAYMPFVIAGLYLLFDKQKYLWGFALTAMGLGLEIRSNHLQITYYLLLLLAVYGLFLLIQHLKDKDVSRLLKSLGVALIAVVLALASNLGKLWTVVEYGQYSTRGESELTKDNTNTAADGLGRDYVFSWSSGKLETFTLFIPNFHGGASQQPLDEDSNLGQALKSNGVGNVKQQLKKVPTYWGDMPFTSGPTYIGAIVFFLFILGILIVPPKQRNWLLAATLFSIILSWGRHFEFFNYLMYDYFPGYNKFRSVSMAIVIALITMPLLGFLAIEQLLKEGLTEKNKKQLFRAGGITAGLGLLFILFAGLFSFEGAVDAQLAEYPDWFLDALIADRQSLLRADAIRSVVLVAIGFAVLYYALKGKIKKAYVAPIMIVLMLIDFLQIDRRYLNDENFVKNPRNKFFAQSEADQAIKQDPELGYRVFNIAAPWQEAQTSYHHRSVGGYHGAKMKRYQELFDYCLDNERREIIKNLQNQNLNFSAFPVTNMLNSKYFKFGNSKNEVLVNQSAWGSAWFVSDVVQVSTADEEIEATCNINSKTQAVINTKKFPVNTSQLSAKGSITVTEYGPRKIAYDVTSTENSIAVFSEIYYPEGWEAFIDGKRVDHFQANYVLRGLEIPAGAKKVEFTFNPKSYIVGNKVMMASSSLLMLAFIGIFVLSFRGQTKKE